MRVCIIYVKLMEERAKSLESELKKNGHTVCSHLAFIEQVRSAQDGMSVSQEIEKCLIGADVCYFLTQDDIARDGEVGLAVLRAVSLGMLIIGVVDGGTVPELIDDHATSVLGPNDVGHLDAVTGAVIRTHPAAAKSPRKISRVKCQ